jgi:hypothetical protein
MADTAPKTRLKAPAPVMRQAADKAPQPTGATRAAAPELMQHAGPTLGLEVQREVAVGQAGDRFEREADATADRVAQGQSVDGAAISPVTPDTLAQAAPQPATPIKEEAKPQNGAEKKPETTPVQKAGVAISDKKPEAMPEKKPEQTAAQKVEAAPEEQATAEQQAARQNPEMAPDQMPVQAKSSGPGPADNIHEESTSPKGETSAEKKAVQTDAAAAGPATGPAASSIAANAISSKGAGKPLDPRTRSTLESRLGTDFSHVRVHDDTAAQGAARDLNARAFTHGSDIWLGPSASQSDTHLMAHEATHVVQQAGGVHRMVQRANGTPANQPVTPSTTNAGAAAPGAPAAPGTPGTPSGAPGTGAKVDHDLKTVSIPELRMPSYSRKASSISAPYLLPPKKERDNTQRQVWSDGVLASPGYAENALKKIDRRRGVKSARTGKLIQVLKPNASDTYIIGDETTLPPKLTLPRWNKSGSFSSYDVDHVKELQLGGDNLFNNMEMLDSAANRSSGSQIHNELVGKIKDAVAPEVAKGKKYRWMQDTDKVQNTYKVTFEAINPSIKVAGDPSNFWSREEVVGGDQVKPMTTLTAAEITARHLVGDDTHLTIYPRPAGGSAKVITWKPDANAPAGGFNGKGIFKNFEASAITYAPGNGGTISGTKKFGKDLIKSKQVGWTLIEMEGLDYTTYVDRTSVLKSLMPLTGQGTSPIELGEVDIGDDGGLVAKGVLRPDLKIFQGLELDLAIESDQLTLSKTFNGGELGNLGPIQITGSSLTLAGGTGGFSVGGDLDFEIERLGKGKISGKGEFGGDTGKSLSIKGYFELDKKVFDGEARIEAGYDDDAFWAKGHLAIGEGKIRGIKSASIDAEYGKDKFSATGSVKPDIPAVEEAGLQIDYAPETGLKFAGDLALKNDTPGISGGKIHIEALQPPGSDQFKVKGTGSAKPKIPGFDTELVVTYDDGTFDASVTAAYNKGRLKGSVTVGATNRPVADGKAAGAAALNAKAITVYGGGSVTVVIAPWLQGTVGVRIIPPNGEIELSGEIALPATLNIFPEKKLDKNIFTIGIDIPIVGVAVAGQRIGIFANISGGLDVSAGIGPGELQELKLGITYNPAHEENTHVTGGAKLHVPAHAGLRLFVRGGIGAGIPIVSAQAGLELGAALGLEGALDTGVQIDWSPATGLILDAEASVYVEPKLKVDLSGFVKVEADLLVTTIDLYDKKWQLAGFEYGSGLRFGVAFPVHYQEGQPFNLSLDQVKFQVPDINPKAMLTDIISRL